MIRRSVCFMFAIAYSSVVLANVNNPWPSLTQRDLQAMHDVIQQTVPVTSIAKGQPNHKYQRWLSVGLQQALARANKAHDFSSYFADLKFYAVGFRDYHTDVTPKLTPINPTDLWPGFIIAKRSDAIKVVYQSQDHRWNHLPPIGATLLSCNGKSIDQLIQTNLTPFQQIYPQFPSTVTKYIPYLLLDDGNPWRDKLSNCDFSVNGKTLHYKLDWKPTDPVNPIVQSVAPSKTENVSVLLNQATYGSAAFRIENFAKNSVWISIPTFSNGFPYKNTTTTKQLARIIKLLPTLRDKHVIVFDLRGNAGGNLSVIHNIVLSLYGGPYLKSLGDRFIWNQAQVWYHRTSVRAMKSYETPFDNATAYEQQQRIKLLNLLKTNLAQHKPITIFKTYDLDQTIKPNSKRLVHAKVILVTDGRCGSACTWFVRDMKSIPGTIQMGRATNVFAPTGNWIPTTLPSGMALLGITTGVTISPKQYLNQPIKPDYYYHGYMGDTKQLQEWVTSVLSNIAKHPSH